MQSFISETLAAILQTTSSFEDVVFVLPSQRAGVFLKHECKAQISSGFLPRIVNIEEFVTEVSGIQKVDAIQLMYHFYTLYKTLEPNPDSFDVFSSWAYTVLQDFNEIDQHLVPPKEIFVYLRDIHRLRKWSVKGTFKETELMKDHFFFMEKLNQYYHALYEFLIQNNIGYQGISYREATKKITEYVAKNNTTQYFFIGFNALNASEELLFQAMLAGGNTKIYWDIDRAFFESNHQAGTFIRKYATQWKYYQQHDIQLIGDHFNQEKEIQIIGASKNITQIKYAGELLATLPSHQNTALVLADETLLPITLNSFPKHVAAVNITMGYPLRDVPTSSLIFAIFQLFITQEKLQKSTTNLFYHKDVVRFIKEPFIYQLLSENELEVADTLCETIVQENNTFVGEIFLNNFFSQLRDTTQEVIRAIFSPYENIANFIERILSLILLIKEQTNTLEKEYLFRFYTAFIQLKNLHEEYRYIQDLKTLYKFFQQLIQSENLSFQGEPLQGLQLMGMLETRVLDFENVIITSVNEGILPGNSAQSSFIPFDVKLEFGLPTYREKDAIFSYHFFRLMQRAKNVYIIYNTEHDSFGNGEKSRFVTQLEMLRNDCIEKIITPAIVTSASDLKEIPKNDAVMQQLALLAQKGISPSALTNYLYNPIAFYTQKVLRIREFEDVEETVAVNTMGTVVHDVLEHLYKPYIRQFITVDTIAEMQQEYTDLVQHYFTKHFKNGDITTGKNRLIFEVAKRFVANFLAQEKALVKDENNTLKILATEQELATTIEVEGINFPIKIKGIVDRIDELNGVIRIIDYKTGKVEANQLKLSDFEDIRPYKYHKAIQVMLYAFLFTQQQSSEVNKPIQAGIYSFKNLKSGFLPMNFSTNYRQPDYTVTEERLQDFMEAIIQILKEIYDPTTHFLEPEELPF